MEPRDDEIAGGSLLYFHCSITKHPVGLRLTGPAIRGAASRWSSEEPTFNPDRIYLLVGVGDPRHLGGMSFLDGPGYVYEVEPDGDLRPDADLGPWKCVSCDSAVIIACVLSPTSDTASGS